MANRTASDESVQRERQSEVDDEREPSRFRFRRRFGLRPHHKNRARFATIIADSAIARRGGGR